MHIGKIGLPILLFLSIAHAEPQCISACVEKNCRKAASGFSKECRNYCSDSCFLDGPKSFLRNHKNSKHSPESLLAHFSEQCEAVTTETENQTYCFQCLCKNGSWDYFKDSAGKPVLQSLCKGTGVEAKTCIKNDSLLIREKYILQLQEPFFSTLVAENLNHEKYAPVQKILADRKQISLMQKRWPREVLYRESLRSTNMAALARQLSGKSKESSSMEYVNSKKEDLFLIIKNKYLEKIQDHYFVE